jgi:hypothetical protein
MRKTKLLPVSEVKELTLNSKELRAWNFLPREWRRLEIGHIINY